MTTSQKLTELELDRAIRDTQECRDAHPAPKVKAIERASENQGRGQKPERASSIDWVLAVAIGALLCWALTVWSDEPNPNSNGQASARRVVT